jgi:hypothetical protein
MRLPIPVFTLSNVYTDIEIMKPKASIIADTKKTLNTSNDPYLALKQFISGCTMSLSCEENEVTDKSLIKDIVLLMPYRTAEFVALQILILYDPEMDAVEGIYTCPRCGHKIITELIKNNEYEIDTRDYISNLEINYMEDALQSIDVELSTPVVIKNKSNDQVIETIETMEINHPTLANCMIANKKYPNDEVRAQFSMYVESLVKVNGNEVDKKYKNHFGMFIFENIKEVKEDLSKLNKAVSEYGIDTKKERTCSECNKTWFSEISMSNFFVSGLTL